MNIRNVTEKDLIRALSTPCATLDKKGTVPDAQVAGQVTDVLEFATRAGFPAEGSKGKFYVDKGTGKAYEWSGTEYVESPDAPEFIRRMGVDLSRKADKVANAIDGNLAAIDANGNLADSGMALRDFAVAESLAPVFAAGDAYEVGDLCTSFDNGEQHKGAWLYKCILATDGSQPAWPETDPTHWALATVEDLLAALRSALAGKQDALSAAQLANIAAVPNKADASALRYDLASETEITTASQETVEGATVNYGEATLADRTGNRVSITATLDELRVTFPPAVSGKLRDFGLRVEVGTGSAALTAPAIVPVAPTGETIKLENNAKQIPALADGAAAAKGVTLLYFSESAPGVFFAKGEQVGEVA